MSELDLTFDELAFEQADLMPAREALALLNIGVVVPVNVAVAVNALTEGSTALAGALQGASLSQS